MAAIVTIGTIAAFSQVGAADEPKLKDLGALTCKEVMRLADDDRRVAIGFLHGYYVGQNGGNLKVDIDKLSEITDTFIDQCLDEPTSLAVETFMGIPR
jgi:hypothetical protein